MPARVFSLITSRSNSANSARKTSANQRRQKQQKLVIQDFQEDLRTGISSKAKDLDKDVNQFLVELNINKL
ncbi:hypothetical protein PEDI_56810 [Persicobacter diffluens]|uniref:Uncharacterized protein n=1 Tax=Persicobacter diffluens TaxID=981 RepID=A0AAN4W3N3_9BACT|nr:hypothetical protein PEDI_51300 [Persicobacter diffluens]GJM65113.1 hypothetical protein PEDI_56650 [Persicobacter diffluens]GJM65129.1 hypothetical protein PEDI_56810 [Persicobacter diffluens]